MSLGRGVLQNTGWMKIADEGRQAPAEGRGEVFVITIPLAGGAEMPMGAAQSP